MIIKPDTTSKRPPNLNKKVWRLQPFCNLTATRYDLIRPHTTSYGLIRPHTASCVWLEVCNLTATRYDLITASYDLIRPHNGAATRTASDHKPDTTSYDLITELQPDTASCVWLVGWFGGWFVSGWLQPDCNQNGLRRSATSYEIIRPHNGAATRYGLIRPHVSGWRSVCWLQPDTTSYDLITTSYDLMCLVGGLQPDCNQIRPHTTSKRPHVSVLRSVCVWLVWRLVCVWLVGTVADHKPDTASYVIIHVKYHCNQVAASGLRYTL